MKQVIYMVDPDRSLCNRVASLLTSSSLATETFDCAEAFLAQSNQIAPDDFLILCSNIPDMNTVELMQELKKKEIKIPVIVMGKEDDVPQAVTFMRAGAIDFITKPFTDQKLKVCVEKILSPATK
jgi:FixJ family two-component response regulator